MASVIQGVPRNPRSGVVTWNGYLIAGSHYPLNIWVNFAIWSIPELHLSIHNVRTFKYTNRYFRLPPGRFFLGPPGYLNIRNPIHLNLRISLTWNPIHLNIRISLTWNKTILGWFPYENHDSRARSQWGRYNLPLHHLNGTPVVKKGGFHK